jgi:hypothetical protein
VRSRKIPKAKSAQPWAELLDECFLATVTRYPTASERKTVANYVKAHENESRAEIIVTILWTL